MIRLERVPFDHSDALALREAMVAEVNHVYGAQRDHGGNDGATGIDPESVVLTLLGRDDSGTPVAHALLRRLGDDLEIKRMFVVQTSRGIGISSALLSELETEARRLGARRVVLHTGDRQLAAVRSYVQHGYTPIPVYEPYVGMPASLCFEKQM